MAALTWNDYSSGIPVVDTADIAAFEQHVGLTLPADYVDAVKAHAGQVTSLECVTVGNGDSVFGALFFISRDALHRQHDENAYRALDDLREWTGKERCGLVPFASNTASGLYCFDGRDARENPPVVFADLDRDPDSPAAVITVAQSFTAFLEKLH